MRVRIEDVAKAAGVSIKTVSRVLNDEPNVTERTRAKVQTAVSELHYRPLPSARILAGRRSYLIAMPFDNPSNNYLMEVEMGILDACRTQHYHLMLAPVRHGGPELLAEIESLTIQLQVDGLVLTPPITDEPEVLARLQALRIPHAGISAREENRGIGVMIDERGAVRAMMAHLIALGHCRIAHILGHPDHGASAWRLDGYREALAHAGLPFDPDLVVQGEFSYESGHAAALRLLGLPERPTAIFAANDDMAAGAICAVSEHGLSVPGDVSVCGFDDTPIARHIHPSLTTVRQPMREMGRLAALELLSEIRSPGSGRIIDVPYTLELRRSTGPVAG